MPAGPGWTGEAIAPMSTDRLWAPWRLAYVSADAKKPDGGDCFICRGLTSGDDRTHLIARRTPLSVVVLNRYPYNNGHLLVAPLAHKGRLDELSPDEMLDGLETVRDMVATLERLMQPHGFNVGLNLGRAAGAGLPGHLHWHIVPRWNGDTNFMAVTGDTRVIVQSLEALYELLTGPNAGRAE
jgi:ATP adenylyltransferase